MSAALAAGLPLLGICRGLQVINVARGGTLHQHLPDLVGHDGHSPGLAGYGPQGERLARLPLVGGAGADRSRRADPSPPGHRPARGRTRGDRLDDDGVIEAAEFRTDEPGSAAAPFTLAVQWHPEAGDDISLFTSLVAAASP